MLRTVLLLLAIVALAQPTIPATPPGRLLKQWLELFNTRDAAQFERFLTTQGSNRLNLHEVERFSDLEIAVLAQERNGVGWASTVLKVDPAKPDVIGSMTIDRTQPSAGATAPKGPNALVKEVGQFAEKLSAEDKFSGVVLIAKDGKPIFQKAYGYADRDKKVPNNIETKFRIGSMNKMFTSVAVAQLVQQGKLKYTDTVRKLLPNYPDKDIAAKITVHHLLTHTSGLGDFFGPEFDRKKNNIRGLMDYLQFFAGKPLTFEPGNRWAYSNAGMIVAGLIIERISGQNYFDYAREHIYKVAGMNDSDSYDKTKPQPNQSIGYTKQNGKWAPNYDTLPRIGSSAGGGDSTAPDLLRFDQALRSHKLLNEELTNTIITWKVSPGGGNKYAYGFDERIVDGKHVVGHSGGAPGMSGNLDMYWESGYTVVVLANLDPPIARQISDYISQRIRQ